MTVGQWIEGVPLGRCRTIESPLLTTPGASHWSEEPDWLEGRPPEEVEELLAHLERIRNLVRDRPTSPIVSTDERLL